MIYIFLLRDIRKKICHEHTHTHTQTHITYIMNEKKSKIKILFFLLLMMMDFNVISVLIITIIMIIAKYRWHTLPKVKCFFFDNVHYKTYEFPLLWSLLSLSIDFVFKLAKDSSFGFLSQTHTHIIHMCMFVCK